MNTLSRIALCSAITTSLIACGGNDKNNNATDSEDNLSQLTITPTNLQTLGADYDYEGWIIVDGSPVSTGTFDIENNQTVPASFNLDGDMAERATTFIVTIEPEVGDVPAPSAVHIIAGDLINGRTTAITNHESALATDFSGIEGRFILATPTNGNATPTQGIWYLDNSSGMAVAGLTLPTLAAGWQYEGWVVDDGPISTGTFTNVAMADSDGAGAAAGPSPGPDFPGQDFITPALDLVGKTAVISVEPNPDNSSAPFSLKPLVAVIEQPSGPQEMTDNVAMTLPSALIVIQ
jgi:hypothetical protein